MRLVYTSSSSPCSPPGPRPSPGQSLAAVARKEEARRKQIKQASKRHHQQGPPAGGRRRRRLADAGRHARAPAPDPAARGRRSPSTKTPSASRTSRRGGRRWPTPRSPSSAARCTPTRCRARSTRLWADFTARDDPAQRAQIETGTQARDGRTGTGQRRDRGAEEGHRRPRRRGAQGRRAPGWMR